MKQHFSISVVFLFYLIDVYLLKKNLINNMVNNFSRPSVRFILTVQQHEENENADHVEKFASTGPIAAKL